MTVDIGAGRTARPVGADAVLVECADAADAAGLARWLADREASSGLGIRELVPGAATLLAVAAPGALAAVVAVIAEAPAVGGLPGAAAGGEVVTLRVRYDGEDLAAVAESLGMSAEALVRAHAAADWRVDLIGFAPGFGYASAADWPHRIPRLATPRERVPAGAVALADGWSAVYPRASPGGWRLIGHTDAVLWDAAAEPPSPLAAGVRIRYVDVTGAP